MKHSMSVGPRAAAAICVLGPAACQRQGPTQSGLLENRDCLQLPLDHTRGAIYVKPGVAGANYIKLIVRPAAGVSGPDVPARDKETTATLQGNLRDVLTNSVSEHFTAVQDPGPARTSNTGMFAGLSALLRNLLKTKSPRTARPRQTTVETSMLILLTCLSTITTLLYSLLWLSDWFQFNIPLWLMWAAITSPPTAVAAGVLAWFLCGKLPYVRRPTMTGVTR